MLLVREGRFGDGFEAIDEAKAMRAMIVEDKRDV